MTAEHHDRLRSQARYADVVAELSAAGYPAAAGQGTVDVALQNGWLLVIGEVVSTSGGEGSWQVSVLDPVADLPGRAVTATRTEDADVRGLVDTVRQVLEWTFAGDHQLN